MNKKYKLLDNYIYMYRYLWQYSPKLVVLSIIEIITNALVPLGGVLLPALIISLLENGCNVFQLVIMCVGIFFILGLLKAVADYLTNHNWWQHIFYRLDVPYQQLFEKTMHIDYALYEQEDTQTMMNKALEEISQNRAGIEGFYHFNITLFTDIIGLMIYMAILAHCHWLIVAGLLALSCIQYAFYVWARNYKHRHVLEQADRGKNQYYLFNQAYDINSGKDIRLYQMQDWLTSIFEKYNDAARKQDAKTQSHYFIYDLVGLLIQVLRDGICYLYLLNLLLNGMSIAEFVLYLGVVRGFGGWFGKISDDIANISNCLLGVNYFRSFEDLKDVYLHDGGKVLDVHDGDSLDIVFDDVSFNYPNSDKKIFDHLSFHIPAKQKVALVGINGAGKTTLVKMLCGFYQPSSGRILVNGVDITTLNIENYFEQIAVLFQDAILLSISIAENITGQNKERIDKNRLYDAIALSGLKTKIDSLANKENTYIGKEIKQDGVRLSGGEIQKLFLARSLYKDAKMLILDEPTAALDAIAEKQMYEKYARLVKDKTSIFISHRLSSTRFCDRILFLEKGKIIEDGTHEQLLQQNGEYAHMFEVQSQYYVKGGNKNENIINA
ncbi:MAG: ABC transporter ATP-binding protein/permease [Erysipelotrichaceae bacterium]|nr:ABC transporter ATP-binding protein/permease [Erysipelotrichaceae bacterium]MDY5251946.1 ABC transporter ATP-binding protein [Erysipelotrichaceae bacterium]